MVNASDFMLNANDYGNINKNISCYSNQEFIEQLKLYCNDVSIKKPMFFMILFLIFSFIEYPVLIWANKKIDEVILYKKFNDYFYIKYTRLDIWAQIMVLKYLCLFASLLIYYLGVKIYD